MKDRILETADRLFYLQGIRAIGVDTIAAEIGISKRTLYNHFPSKDALISAYLERRFVAPAASDKPPVEQILGTFDLLERRFSAKDFRGCPFVNAVAELGSEDQRSERSRSPSRKAAALWFRDLLRAARRRRCGRPRDAARAAGRRLDRAGSGAQRPRDGARGEGSRERCCSGMRASKSAAVARLTGPSVR